jgi:DNA-binding beta-propeller fold protein YncE
MARRISVTASVLVALLVVAGAGLWMAQGQTPASAPSPAGELKVVQSIIGDGNGGWDDLTVDPDGKRVYVSRATRVMVFDTEAGKLAGEVADTPGVHGIALVPERNLGFASCGRDGTIAVFDLKKLKVSQKVKAGKNPDGIIYDPASQRVYAFNHTGGDITIVDPAALDKEPNTLAVGGTLEFGVADGAGHVYVNVEDKNEVAVIDSKLQKVTAHWSVAPGDGPTGLAIDVAHRRLFAGCGNQKMVVLDADTGKVLASPAVGSGVDGVAFDPGLGLAVSSNGRDGTLTAVREAPAGQFAPVQTLTTVKGARTIRGDAKTHRFYLPCNLPGEGGGAAKFGLLVVGAGAEAKAPAAQPGAAPAGK